VRHYSKWEERVKLAYKHCGTLRFLIENVRIFSWRIVYSFALLSGLHDLS